MDTHSDRFTGETTSSRLHVGRIVVLVAALACLLATMTAPAVAMAGADAPVATGDSPTLDQQDAPTNETTNGTDSDADTPTNGRDTTGTEQAADGSPGTAAGLRVGTVQFEEDWMNTEVVETDEEFATTGPYAIFTLSEAAESVRIAQSSADARLLEGDQTVHVEYADDAASADGETYFQLEIFFADGSTKQIGLTASQTEVSVAGARWAEYSEYIEMRQEAAAERGYEASPEGLTAYHEWQVDRIEIIESFLVERAQQLFALAVLFARNPLAWALALIVLGLAAFRREQVHGQALDRIENDAGETARKEAQLRQAHRDHQQTANEEPITQLAAVDDMQAQYWKDAFGIESVRQLAELAKRGPYRQHAAADGGGPDVAADGGAPDTPAIAAINAAEIRDSWLADVITTNRLADGEEALSCMRAALVRMDSTYGLGYQYHETQVALEDLLDELQAETRGY